MMPFYGTTPEEAAKLLADWLTLITTPPAVQAARPAVLS